jgi:hypothetical protein
MGVCDGTSPQIFLVIVSLLAIYSHLPPLSAKYRFTRPKVTTQPSHLNPRSLANVPPSLHRRHRSPCSSRPPATISLEGLLQTLATTRAPPSRGSPSFDSSEAPLAEPIAFATFPRAMFGTIFDRSMSLQIAAEYSAAHRRLWSWIQVIARLHIRSRCPGLTFLQIAMATSRATHRLPCEGAPLAPPPQPVDGAVLI